MRVAGRAILIATFLALSGAAAAGPLEDANAAYRRGDYATAFVLTRPLADQGVAAAQFNLGFMYEHGHGVAQDYAAAARWYRLAADQGVAVAQFNLGVMYAEGRGVAQDYVQANMWFNLAAAQGNKEAVKARDDLTAKMTPAQIAEAQRLAAEWKPTIHLSRDDDRH